MVRRINLHRGQKRKKRVYRSKYTLLNIVQNARIFTAGLHGTTRGNILRLGGDAFVWSMSRTNVMQ